MPTEGYTILKTREELYEENIRLKKALKKAKSWLKHIENGYGNWEYFNAQARFALEDIKKAKRKPV
jgi:hypothetical protein